MGLSIILGIVAGFSIGCLATMLIAINYYHNQQKKIESRITNRHSVISTIGKQISVVENAYSAQKLGTMQMDALKEIIISKCEEITNTLNTNLDILDAFYVRYVERFIEDNKSYISQTNASYSAPVSFGTEATTSFSSPYFATAYESFKPQTAFIPEESSQRQAEFERQGGYTPPQDPTYQIEQSGEETVSQTETAEPIPAAQPYEYELPEVSMQQQPEAAATQEPVFETQSEYALQFSEQQQQPVDQSEQTVTYETAIHELELEKMEQQVEGYQGEPAPLPIAQTQEYDLSFSIPPENSAPAEVNGQEMMLSDESPELLHTESYVLPAAIQPMEAIEEYSLDNAAPYQVENQPVAQQEQFEPVETEKGEETFEVENREDEFELLVQDGETLDSEVDEEPIKGMPVFDTSFDISATQEFNVKEYMDNGSDQQPAAATKTKEPSAPVESENMIESLKNELSKVEKTPARSQPTNESNLITGNDVIDKLNKFFGIKNN